MTDDKRDQAAEYVVHGVGYCSDCRTYSDAKETQRKYKGGTIYRKIDTHIGDRLILLETERDAALARAEAAERQADTLRDIIERQKDYLGRAVAAEARVRELEGQDG